MKIEKSSLLYKIYLYTNTKEPKINCDYILGIMYSIITMILFFGMASFIIFWASGMSIGIGQFLWQDAHTETFFELFSKFGLLGTLKFLVTGFAFAFGIVALGLGVVVIGVWGFEKIAPMISLWHQKVKNKFCSPTEIID